MNQHSIQQVSISFLIVAYFFTQTSFKKPIEYVKTLLLTGITFFSSLMLIRIIISLGVHEMLKTLSSAFIFSLFFCFDAYAYIDPGSGGFVFQMIMAFFAAISASVVYFWNGIMNFIKSILRQKK